MDTLAAGYVGMFRKDKGDKESHNGIDAKQCHPIRLRERNADPAGWSRQTHGTSRQAEKEPHTKKAEPGEQLYERQLFHCGWHITNGRDNFGNQRTDDVDHAAMLSAHAFEGSYVFRRILLARQHRSEDGQ